MYLNMYASSIGCLAIEDLLRQENCRLIKLDLSWNPLGSQGGEALAGAFEVSIYCTISYTYKLFMFTFNL
jgi:hypothetical protein